MSESVNPAWAHSAALHFGKRSMLRKAFFRAQQFLAARQVKPCKHSAVHAEAMRFHLQQGRKRCAHSNERVRCIIKSDLPAEGGQRTACVPCTDGKSILYMQRAHEFDTHGKKHPCHAVLLRNAGRIDFHVLQMPADGLHGNALVSGGIQCACRIAHAHIHIHRICMLLFVPFGVHCLLLHSSIRSFCAYHTIKSG